MSLPRIVRPAAVGAALLVAGLACSTDTKRDQFYGTDVGVGWIAPDATVREARDGGSRDGAEAGVDGGAGDVVPADGGVAGDGGVETDATSADAPPGDTL
jgi:hypothetical protein